MPFNTDLPPRRVLIAAMRGNAAAANRIAEWGLPQLRGRVDEIRRQVERRRQEEWDEAEAREWAMNGNVSPEATVGALADIHRAIIRVTAYTPAAIMADEGSVEAMNDLWLESIYRLMLTLHNPTIKYAIVGGFRPEIREQAEDYFERYATEIWGTVYALTSDEEIEASDFPPETGQVIRQVGTALADQGAQGDD